MMKEYKSTHRISGTLHGSFGEYFGRVIYDGIWVGRGSSVPNTDGIRNDVTEGCREAGLQAFRWPGGCCADHYHWQDGIGGKRYDRLHFVAEKEPRDWCNDFGTDEFVSFCRKTGMEPVITANAASGSPEEFMSWFEYCNGGVNTRYGSLRAENGHPEPYSVTTWGIGNTDENAWHRVKQSSCDWKPYALDYLRFETCLVNRRQMYPGLKFVGLGMSIRHGLSGWTEGFLDYVTDDKRKPGPELLSVHHYLGGMKNRLCGDAVDYTDDEYEFTLDSLERYSADIGTHRRIIAEHTNPAFPTAISFDEWGLWHPEASMKNDQNQRQTMRDAVFSALALHIFYRNSDIVRYAMETQISNLLHSLFETRGADFYKTPVFYVFKLYKEHLGQYLWEISSSPRGGKGEMLVSVSPDYRRATVTLVNRDLYREAAFDRPDELTGYTSVRSDLLTSADVRGVNSFDDPFVIADRPFGAFGTEVILPPYSVVRFVLEK